MVVSAHEFRRPPFMQLERGPQVIQDRGLREFNRRKWESAPRRAAILLWGGTGTVRSCLSSGDGSAPAARCQSPIFRRWFWVRRSCYQQPGLCIIGTACRITATVSAESQDPPPTFDYDGYLDFLERPYGTQLLFDFGVGKHHSGPTILPTEPYQVLPTPPAWKRSGPGIDFVMAN